MVRKMILLTALTLLAVPPAQAQVPQLPMESLPDSARAAVLEFVTSYYAALSDRDWERFADHFWPGAIITTVWQPEGEPAARVFSQTVREFVEKAPAGPGSREIFEERMLAADVQVRGDLANVFARYTARFGDPGDVMEWKGVDSFSLLRHEGAWRIVSLAFAPER